MCWWVNTPLEEKSVKTAVASVILKLPILKHLYGIFGLTDVSGTSMKKILQEEGQVILYVGGIAELFKSSRKEERLYLNKRKGFIKLALREGADIVPVYLFGNTHVLTVLKSGPLAKLARSLQVTLTYFWGKYYLPIPRDEKLLCVIGKQLGLPHVPEPTVSDIDKWHTKYCNEVTRLFNDYKERVPAYKHKKIYID